eukprot:3182916-Prymnesium_polylepis.1
MAVTFTPASARRVSTAAMFENERANELDGATSASAATRLSTPIVQGSDSCGLCDALPDRESALRREVGHLSHRVPTHGSWIQQKVKPTAMV